MSITIKQTTSYPTRYAAFDDPGVLYEQAGPTPSRGGEMAVYSEAVPNVVHDSIEDGIYVEIVGYPDGRIIVLGHLSTPDRYRTGTGIRKVCRSYEDARAAALIWIAAAKPVLTRALERAAVEEAILVDHTTSELDRAAEWDGRDEATCAATAIGWRPWTVSKQPRGSAWTWCLSDRPGRLLTETGYRKLLELARERAGAETTRRAVQGVSRGR